jgi:hypothetical protein
MWIVENWVGIAVVAGLIGLYILIYFLNKKTPIPEECKDIINDAACNTCNNFTCSHKG